MTEEDVPVRAVDWVEGSAKAWVKMIEAEVKLYVKWRDAGRSWRFLEPGLMRQLEAKDMVVPKLYHDTLTALREIVRDGGWPGTTVGRRTVMVEDGKHFRDVMKEKDAAKNKDGAGESKDAIKRSKVKVKAGTSNSTGGSFSVGYMPTSTLGSSMPSSNSRYPSLVRSAFLLERHLAPSRPPSSTIAVNCNAQFRPHTDKGAGAGQGKSLIVALGDYAGGELVVEGEEVDIRYRPREFDGWRERHYTKFFVGERFSLVWFTPKGCEGLRGVDLKVGG